MTRSPFFALLASRTLKKLEKCKPEIQIITDLIQESNVQFLDIGDEDKPDKRIYETQLFACGEAFSASMFDSVTSSVFHTPGILKLVESLVYPSGKTSIVKTIPIANTNFSNKNFVDFYESQLDENSMCLGLFRELHDNSTQRFVITSPNPLLPLKESDIAFVITE